MPVTAYIKEQMQRKAALVKLIENAKKLPITRRTKFSITQRVSDLEALWNEFKELHKTIIHGADKAELEDMYFKADLYSEVYELYIEGKVDIMGLLPASESTESSSHLPGTHMHHHQDTYNLKLPKIELPQFSGDYTKWITYHDLFKTLVHENERLSAVQKLHYLQSSLSGEAKRLIQHFQISQANYLPAWSMLKSRYQNNRVLVNNYLKILLTQNSITSENSSSIKKLLDVTNECLLALSNLEVPTDKWDTIIIYLTVQKLPQETHQLWEQSLANKSTLPTYNELKSFLESRFRTLEFIAAKPTASRLAQTSNQSIQNKTKTYNTTIATCCICSASHIVRQCDKFLQLNAKEKLDLVKQKHLCVNCLDPRHSIGKCSSRYSCFKCKRRHNTLLHDSYSQSQSQSTEPISSSSSSPSPQIQSNHIKETAIETTTDKISSHFCENTNIVVLLATAIVQVETATGRHFLRALLDQGSEASFMTETAVQQLGLKRKSAYSKVTGLGQANAGSTRGKVDITFTSRFNLTPKFDLTAFILPSLTDLIPSTQIINTDWNHLQGLTLADPSFHTPGKIDLLLGADIYAELVSDGVRRGPPNTPLAQNTSLGWIVSGRIGNSNTSHKLQITSMLTTITIDEQLRRFWELEEIITQPTLTDAEKECEEIFNNTHSRQADGRFVVQLPFKNPSDLNLGSSRQFAQSRFHQLERRFQRDESLHQEYAKCLNEYLDLRHMIPIPHLRNNPEVIHYYLPHHAVIKESSTTTKLRVVFDASQKTTSGQSLNDVLLTGPTIQDDLLLILLRWRTHAIAFSADIEKMYRQVKIIDDHHRFHRILWRNTPTDELKEYCLTTVTFGTTSAPFLAIKALRKLAEYERDRFPIAAEITLRDFYVDNILSGADTLHEALNVQNELLQMLSSGGFPLRKWSANHEELLTSLPSHYLEKATTISFDQHEGIKTLGIVWSPITDQFHFKINLPNVDKKLSKRSILSDVSKLFDPLGWISPIVIIGKIIIQKLWLRKLEWDDEVDSQLREEWIAYRKSLEDIQQIHVPRWIRTTKSKQQVYQVHGFSDASIAAYAAVVYLRVMDERGEVSINLLASKTKVAPIKTISLPRLELCGMHLLSKLMSKLLPTLPHSHEIEQHAWTDSTIVLSWLQGPSSKWKTFVANRITKIHEGLKDASWHHVPTDQNPADCASRGLTPVQLKDKDLWWRGPSFLRNEKSNWPKTAAGTTTLEQRNISSLTAKVKELDLINRFSTLTKLIRVVAYIFRFIKKTREKSKVQNSWITAREYNDARLFLVKEAQEQDFAAEIQALTTQQELPENSKIINLTPFLDENKILRVGGRLQSSMLPATQQHPIILQGSNNLARLIVDNIHRSSLHGGTTLVLSLVRKTYWILNGRNLVKSCIFKCVACYRQRAKMQKQLMGNLPHPRITPSRPFTHTGVDYCGPFDIKMSKGRGVRSYKGYISLFICLSTKAIHIEVVSDYSTSAFLAAFKRFVSRRGTCSDMYSDCGTNFVGAKATLDRDLKTAIANSLHETAETIAKDGTHWHLIPPASPHFGGLWEAGVKSVKFHMKRILSNTKLTYEELATVVTQIEASLNSRPLCPLHDDVDSLDVLTPGHFLIGNAIRSPPEPSLLDNKISALDKWKYLQQLSQQFWKKWSEEYVTRLQQRPKWNKTQPNVRVGDMALLKDDRLPPCKWPLCRIVETHPGPDGLVRVVTVKTKDNKLKRPITKISILPIDDNQRIQSLYQQLMFAHTTHASEELLENTHEIRHQ